MHPRGLDLLHNKRAPKLHQMSYILRKKHYFGVNRVCSGFESFFFFMTWKIILNRTGRRYTHSIEMKRGSLSHCGITMESIHLFGPVLYATPRTVSGIPRTGQFHTRFLNVIIAGFMWASGPPDNRITILTTSPPEVTSAHLTSSLPLNSDAFPKSVFKIQWVSSAFSTQFSSNVPDWICWCSSSKWNTTSRLVKFSLARFNYSLPVKQRCTTWNLTKRLCPPHRCIALDENFGSRMHCRSTVSFILALFNQK